MHRPETFVGTIVSQIWFFSRPERTQKGDSEIKSSPHRLGESEQSSSPSFSQSCSVSIGFAVFVLAFSSSGPSSSSSSSTSDMSFADLKTMKNATGMMATVNIVMTMPQSSMETCSREKSLPYVCRTLHTRQDHSGTSRHIQAHSGYRYSPANDEHTKYLDL